MRQTRLAVSAGALGLFALAVTLLSGCTHDVSDQGASATVTVGPSPSPTFTRISVPTWNFTDRMPMDGNLFMARLKADGSCAVIGNRPPYSVVVWPRGWYATQAASGQITIYTRTDRPYAKTGGQVGFSGGFQETSKGQHPCLAKYPTMTMAEARNRAQ
jgi:hypothetical protein